MDDVVVVNDKDEVIGTMPREIAHANGTPHRIAVVYVVNPAGEILVQVRMDGGLDHSSAGHVDPGEEYIETAKRELKEELGMDNVDFNIVGHGISEEILPDKNEHRIHVMQIFSCMGEPGELQEDEVRQVYWADPEKILVEMRGKTEDVKFAGGFKASLPIYLAAKSQLTAPK
ncbi:MAG: NUDIX domain-containing protein [Candidatus Kaiserbacteria bacterium]|nr:NUDIX domain-containing protein [Candidatus Kaiserbacteria bacterium]